MTVKIDNNNAEGIHKALNLILKTKYSIIGYEHLSVFPKKIGNLTLKSYDFNKGFNFNILCGDIATLTQLEFAEDSNNYLRFFFIKRGELIHTVSSSIRYRLTDNFSCMVAAKSETNQLFTFPVQNNIEILFLQIETKRFSIDLKSDFFSLSKEIGDVLMNEQMESPFIYQSNYSLSISDTINEITETPKEGIVKRFFLESKALELLWQQTELYRQELKLGYNQKLLRKPDISLIKKAKDYIHTNLDIKLTLSSVARAIGTNETKLKTGFKILYGKTFSEILRSERLYKAKTLLKEGQMSIKEIGNTCGYKSTSMFSVRFKERFGDTPGKYLNS